MSLSTYAVVDNDIEVDFALEHDGTLAVMLAEPEGGEQLSADLTFIEARALRDWLSKALESV